MKKFSEIFKRSMAMLLALVMILSCSNLGVLIQANAHEADHDHKHITLGELIVQNYDLSNQEKEILTSGLLTADVEYAYNVPGSDDDLISVTESETTITAKRYGAFEGTYWIPASFAIVVEGNEVETGTLTQSQTSEDEYTGTYEHDGNAFAVVVTYTLDKSGLTDAQLAMLNVAHNLEDDIAMLNKVNKDASVSVAGQNVNPMYILDVLTMTFEELGELTGKNVDLKALLGEDAPETAVDLIYQLANGGIEYPKYIKIDYNGTTLYEETITIELKLPVTTKTAARDLYAQKNKSGNEGKLDLTVFFETNKALSQLELLATKSAELNEKLAAIHKSIETLSNPGSGLNNVVVQIEEVIAMLETDEDWGYKALVDEALAEGKATATEMIYEKINEAIAEKVAPYQSLLAELGLIVPTVEAPANEGDDPFASLKAFHEEIEKAVYSAINDKVNEAVAGYADLLEDFDITVPVVNSEADLDKLLDLPRQIEDAVYEQINAEVEKKMAGYAELLTEFGITVPVVDSKDDLDALRELPSQIEAKIYEKINAEAEAKMGNYADLLNEYGITIPKVDATTKLDPLKNLPAQIKAKIYENINAEAKNAVGQYADLMNKYGITVPTVTPETGLAPLSTMLNDAEAKVYAEINEKLAAYEEQFSKYDIVIPQVDASTGLQPVKDMLANAEGMICNAVDTELQDALKLSSVSMIFSMLGIPTKVEDKDDLITLTNALADASTKAPSGAKAYIENLLTSANTALAVFDEVAEAEGKITETEGFIAQLDEAQAKIDEAVAAANDALAEVDAAEAMLNPAITEAEGYLAQLNAAKTDINTAVDTAEGYFADLKEAESLIKEGVDGAKENLAKLPEVQTNIDAGVAEAEGLLDDFDVAIEDARQQAYAQLEAAAAEAKTVKEMLELLVAAMEGFCTSVKPVVDYANSWYIVNNKDVLAESITSAGYKMLSENAAGITKEYTAEDVKDTLHVDEVKVQYNMSMFDVTITANAYVMDFNDATKENEQKDLTSLTHTETLRAGATLDEVQAKVDAFMESVLTQWKTEGLEVEHYNVTKTDLSELMPNGVLDADINVDFSYAPKMLKVSFGEGFENKEPEEVPYGYTWIFPKHETQGMAYSYVVDYASDKEDERFSQNKTLKLLEDVMISRSEGEADQYKTVIDLVQSTDVASDETKSFLNSLALDKGASVWLVSPKDGSELIHQENLFVDGTVTAETVDAELGGLSWKPVTAVVKDAEGNTLETVQFDSNGVATITQTGYAKIYVSYELQLTVAALEKEGITEKALLDKLNLQKELAEAYPKQVEALEILLKQRSRLAQIGNYKADLENAIKSGVLDNPDTVAAAQAVINNLNGQANGQFELYNLLMKCDTDNDGKVNTMLPYYQYYKDFEAQVTFVKNALQQIAKDEKVIGLLGDRLTLFNEVTDTLSGVELTPVHEDVLTSNETALENLVLRIAETSNAKTYAASDLNNLVMTATVDTNGADSVAVTVKVTVEGLGSVTNSDLTFKAGTVLAEDDIKKLEAKVAAVEADFEKTYSKIDRVHFVREGQLLQVGDTLTKDFSVELTWKPIKYTVNVVGTDVQIDYDHRTVALPGTGDTNISYEYTYTYTKNGEEITETISVKVDSYSHTISKDDFDLIFANGTLYIKRTAKDLRTAAMIEMIDGMNGAAVLTQDENGKYAIVLRLDGADMEAGLMNFVMGLFLKGADKEMTMGGEDFYTVPEGAVAGQFHLQALVDLLLNSGIGTESLLELIGPDGTIKSMAAPGTVIGAHNYENLGGKLLKSTMTFAWQDGISVNDVDFYITLTGAGEDLLSVRNGVEDAKNAGVIFVLDDGMVTATLDLNDGLYGMYATALTMVGEADIDDINALNAKIAFTYLVDLIAPLMEDGASLATVSNTLDKFGTSADLSAYNTIYDTVKMIYGEDMFKYSVENDSMATITLDELSIKELIDSLQKTVDEMIAGMGLPGDVEIDLSKMIAEYENGLNDVDISIDLLNLDKEYVAMGINAAALKAADLQNAVRMLTAADLASQNAQGLAYLSDCSAIILLADVTTTGTLTLNGATVLDLNGKVFTCNINAGTGRVFIVDSDYEADGTVNGTVTGSNVMILGGKYSSDVTQYLKAGYAQNKGVVSNEYFALSGDEENIIVTMNLTPNAEIASREYLLNTALDIVAELVVTHYNTASLKINNHKIYHVDLTDVVDMTSGTQNSLISEVLRYVSASDLAELVDDIVSCLVDDFAVLKEALETDGVIATFDFATAPWDLALTRKSSGAEDAGYLDVSLKASDDEKKATTKKLKFVIADESTLKDKLISLVDVLIATETEVTSNCEVKDIELTGNTFNMEGKYTGTLKMNFAAKPDYVIAMAVILADGNSALEAKLVDAINTYYATHGADMVKLETVFDALTVNAITTALRNTARTTTLAQMAKNIGLTGDVYNAVAAIENDFDPAVDLLGIILRRYAPNVNGTLGGLKKLDKAGEPYYGGNATPDFARTIALPGSYNLACSASGDVTAELYLFSSVPVKVTCNGAVTTYDSLVEALTHSGNHGEDCTVTVCRKDVKLAESVTIDHDMKIVYADYIDFGENVIKLANNVELTTDKELFGAVITVVDSNYVVVHNSAIHGERYVAEPKIAVYEGNDIGAVPYAATSMSDAFKKAIELAQNSGYADATIMLNADASLDADIELTEEIWLYNGNDVDFDAGDYSITLNKGSKLRSDFDLGNNVKAATGWELKTDKEGNTYYYTVFMKNYKKVGTDEYYTTLAEALRENSGDTEPVVVEVLASDIEESGSATVYSNVVIRNAGNIKFNNYYIYFDGGRDSLTLTFEGLSVLPSGLNINASHNAIEITHKVVNSDEVYVGDLVYTSKVYNIAVSGGAEIGRYNTLADALKEGNIYSGYTVNIYREVALDTEIVLPDLTRVRALTQPTLTIRNAHLIKVSGEGKITVADGVLLPPIITVLDADYQPMNGTALFGHSDTHQSIPAAGSTEGAYTWKVWPVIVTHGDSNTLFGTYETIEEAFANLSDMEREVTITLNTDAVINNPGVIDISGHELTIDCNNYKLCDENGDPLTFKMTPDTDLLCLINNREMPDFDVAEHHKFYMSGTNIGDDSIGYFYVWYKDVTVFDAEGKAVWSSDKDTDLTEAFKNIEDNYTIGIYGKNVTLTEDVIFDESGITVRIDRKGRFISSNATIYLNGANAGLTLEGFATYDDVNVAVTDETKYCFICDDANRIYKTRAHNYVNEIVDDFYLKNPATCTTAAEYYKSCDGCGRKGTETFFSGETLDHDYVEKADAKYLKSGATCTEAAVYYKSCSVCGAASTETFKSGEALKHQLVEKVDAKYLKNAATCTEAAVYYKSCSVCGAASTETFKSGAALGHKLVEKVEAKYLKSAATCTEAAVYYKSCSVCGVASTETFKSGEALGHAWDEGKVTTAPTCEADGVMTYTCKNDASHTKTEAIKAAGHTLVEKVEAKYLKSAATCTEAAVYYKSCSVCGVASTETFKSGTALGHAWDEGKVTTAPTCDAEGVKTYTCKNDASHTKTEAIKATGHGELKLVGAVEPTYTEAGYTGDEVCSVCGKVINKGSIIPVKVYEIVVTDAEGIVIYSGSDLIAALEKATDGCTVTINALVSMVEDVKLASAVTIKGAENIIANGKKIFLSHSDAKITADAELENVVSLTDGYIVMGDGNEYTQSEIAAPIGDHTVAGVKAEVDSTSEERYLFVDIDPTKGKTLDELRESLTYEDLADYTVTMTIKGNNGTALVKTADTLIVTVEDKDGHLAATITYTLIVMGDVNCDGRALSNDATAMMQLFFGGVTGSKAMMLAANMNCDGAIEKPVIGAADARRNMHKYFDWGKTEGGYESALQ